MATETNRTLIPFTNEHFAAFCLSMIGQPYWYGCVVYKCASSLLSRKAAQYPSHYGSSRTARYKQDIAAKKVCADCVGGCKGYAWTGGGIGVVESIGTDKTFASKYGANGCPDKSANGMFTYSKSKGMDWGVIGTLPEIVGLALHKDGHIGYYVGNGYSTSGDGELMLTILASYAQEESRSVSENCKWQIRKKFEVGQLVNWRFMYGYRIVRGKIEIDAGQAAVVQGIFQDYLNGVGVTEIAAKLREDQVPALRGGVWSPKRVTDLLKNEKYPGNALLQKKYVADHLTKVEKINHGQLPKYYAEETHPAIITPETYAQARSLMEHNRIANGIACDAPQYSAFTGKIICGQCGKYYRRKVSRYETAWNCGTYLVFGKAHCHTKQIPEDILMATTASVLGIPRFDEAVFQERVESIRVPAFNHLLFVFKDGTEIERVWQDKSRRDSWNDQMRKQAATNARRRYEK